MRLALWVFGSFVIAVFAITMFESEKSAERLHDARQRAAELDDGASRAWNYRTSRDEMRGTTLYTAEIEAQGAPLNAPRLIIQRTEKRYDVAIRSSLKSGANEFPGCIAGRRWHVNVKFDDGAIQDVACQEGMDALLPPSLLPALKKSSRMMIEMQAGGYPVQYTFRTAGLSI